MKSYFIMPGGYAEKLGDLGFKCPNSNFKD